MPAGVRMSQLKDQVAALEQENRDLKERLEMQHGEAWRWGEVLDQPTRDRLAARALMQCWCDYRSALIRLGYNKDQIAGKNGYLTDLGRAESARIFDTDGVRSILNRDLAKVEAERSAIIARQAEIALHGSDDAAVRATQQLAKMTGWQIVPDEVHTHTHIATNIFALIGKNREAEQQTIEQVDSAGFLDHEPGEAIKIAAPIEARGVVEAMEEA
jgi:hypothetical protein